MTVYDNRPTFWTDMTAQGSFCSVAPPLGQPWRVWGSSVSYYSDEDGTITIPSTTPADGTITFDGEGKKASLGGSFPWFVLDINLLLNEDPPKARVWLWDGQLSHQREVVVSLVADPNCQPTG